MGNRHDHETVVAAPPPCRTMTALGPDAPAVSPCIKVCTLDPASTTCLGCGRTLDEIARWGRASEPERRAILALLPERLARLSITDRPPLT
jgi:hypothetical protein